MPHWSYYYYYQIWLLLRIHVNVIIWGIVEGSVTNMNNILGAMTVLIMDFAIVYFVHALINMIVHLHVISARRTGVTVSTE